MKLSQESWKCNLKAYRDGVYTCNPNNLQFHGLYLLFKGYLLPCNPNNLQFYGLYLLFKGYLLLNCGFLEPQVIVQSFRV